MKVAHLPPGLSLLSQYSSPLSVCTHRCLLQIQDVNITMFPDHKLCPSYLFYEIFELLAFSHEISSIENETLLCLSLCHTVLICSTVHSTIV